MSYSAQVLADSPAAYYRMNEASGQPQDSAGANHTTIVGGTPTYGEVGAIESDATDDAITFDGTTEYFAAPDHATLDVGDVFTLACWAKRNGGSGFRNLLDKGSNGFQFSISGDGAGDTLTLGKQDVADIVWSTISVSNAVWHYSSQRRTERRSSST